MDLLGRSPVGAAWRIFWTTSLTAFLLLAAVSWARHALGIGSTGGGLAGLVVIVLWIAALWYQWRDYRRARRR